MSGIFFSNFNESHRTPNLRMQEPAQPVCIYFLIFPTIFLLLIIVHAYSIGFESFLAYKYNDHHLSLLRVYVQVLTRSYCGLQALLVWQLLLGSINANSPWPIITCAVETVSNSKIYFQINAQICRKKFRGYINYNIAHMVCLDFHLIIKFATKVIKAFFKLNISILICWFWKNVLCFVRQHNVMNSALCFLLTSVICSK